MSNDDSHGQQPSQYFPDPQQPYFRSPDQSPTRQNVPPQEPTQQYFQPARQQFASPHERSSLQRYFPPAYGEPAYVPPGKLRGVRNLRRRTANLIILSLVGALVVVIAVVAELNGSKAPAASKASAPSVVTAPSSEPVQNATSVRPPGPSLSELEQQWAAGPAGAAGVAVVSDLKSFQAEMADVEARDYGPVVSTCQQLETDATAALNAPANPDRNVAQHLSAAYADTQAAASACVTGVQTLDVSALEQSELEFSQAKTQVGDAIAAIDADCPDCDLNGQLS